MSSAAESGFTATDEQPILVTPAAVDAAKKAIAAQPDAGDGLRVSVVGGGCSGYQYNLDFEKQERSGDSRMSFDGLTVYLDPISAGYLRGTVIDYVDAESGSGFKFNNPNARRTCGCASSAEHS